VYAELRKLDHLHHDAKNNLYIAARHEDVFHISRNNELYCSRFGVRPIIAGDMSIITLDGDDHIRTPPDQRRLHAPGARPHAPRA
jgi:cytochrome P450